MFKFGDSLFHIKKEPECFYLNFWGKPSGQIQFLPNEYKQFILVLSQIDASVKEKQFEGYIGPDKKIVISRGGLYFESRSSFNIKFCWLGMVVVFEAPMDDFIALIDEWAKFIKDPEN